MISSRQSSILSECSTNRSYLCYRSNVSQFVIPCLSTIYSCGAAFCRLNHYNNIHSFDCSRVKPVAYVLFVPMTKIRRRIAAPKSLVLPFCGVLSYHPRCDRPMYCSLLAGYQYSSKNQRYCFTLPPLVGLPTLLPHLSHLLLHRILQTLRNTLTPLPSELHLSPHFIHHFIQIPLRIIRQAHRAPLVRQALRTRVPLHLALQIAAALAEFLLEVRFARRREEGQRRGDADDAVEVYAGPSAEGIRAGKEDEGSHRE